MSPRIDALPTVTAILVTMALLAWIETVVPLQPRGRWHRAHLAPNLVLTFATFASNIVFNAGLILALATAQAHGIGVLARLAAPDLVGVGAALLGLDFAFYVAHVAMHASPVLWRFHRVHHCDPAVDVTTTIRQHPGEGVIRYVAMAAVAVPLGITPAAFAVYRIWSALHGLVNHANVRVPPGLDTLLSAVFGTPNMHKVHHARALPDTDTNFGTILSVFDRAFGTFTPSVRGQRVSYGLAGLEDDATQTAGGLLRLPFRRDTRVAVPDGISVG